MQVSISEAARLYLVSRNTIYEHAKAGRLTIRTDELGKKSVAVADLHRLYEPRQHGVSSIVEVEQPMTPENDKGQAALQAKIDLLEQRIQDKDDLVKELREERTWLRGQVEKQTDQIKLLTDQSVQPSRPWWRLWNLGVHVPPAGTAG